MTIDVTDTLINTLNQYSNHTFTHASLDRTLTIKELNLDSLDFLEILYEMEEELDCTIDSESLKKIETVADLAAAFSATQVQDT